jgi:hypothetical protein
LISLLPSETQLEMTTSCYIFPNNWEGRLKKRKKKKKSATYLPYFFWLCYPNYTFFFCLTMTTTMIVTSTME